MWSDPISGLCFVCLFNVNLNGTSVSYLERFISIAESNIGYAIFSDELFWTIANLSFLLVFSTM